MPHRQVEYRTARDIVNDAAQYGTQETRHMVPRRTMPAMLSRHGPVEVNRKRCPASGTAVLQRMPIHAKAFGLGIDRQVEVQ